MAAKTKSAWGMLKPVFVLAILAVCAVMLFFGFQETGVKLSGGQIQLEGMYGMKIGLAEVQEISLIENSMREIGVGRRTNGFGGIGSTFKGHFESEELGKHMLFVDADASPTICIQRNNGEDVYLSFRDGQKTRDYYAKLCQFFESY